MECWKLWKNNSNVMKPEDWNEKTPSGTLHAAWDDNHLE